MVWGAMSLIGVGPIHRIEGIMDQHVYVDDVLRDVLLPYAEDMLIGFFRLASGVSASIKKMSLLF